MDPIETDENGKLRPSLEQFDQAFRQLLQGIKVPTINATVVHKTPGVMNPGIGELVIDAATWAARWQSHADNAASDWETRAQTPSRDPITAAIAANKKRLDRLAEAESKQKWLKTMQKRKFEDYASGIVNAGAQTYKAGIDRKAAKALARFTELRPKVLALKQSIQQMSDATDADREKRMTAARKGMIAIGQS